MDTIFTIIQILVALGILNVWIFRYTKQTKWRGGNAKNMKEEFATYGLPVWFMYIIGFLKISSAILLIMGLWIPPVTQPAAILLALLMFGAISMHIKINDPFRKAIPATGMFVAAVFLALFA